MGTKKETNTDFVPTVTTLKSDLSESKLDDKFIADSKVTPKRFSPLFRQWLAAAGPIMATIGSGMTSGYSATLLPQLKMDNSTIVIDEEISSWIASLAALPMAFGCILAGWLIEYYGRRATHFIVSIPFVAGWILISFSTNLFMLLVGRFITGFCVGILGPTCAIYIGEISDPKYRGILLAAVSLAISIGLFAAHLLGTFLSWQLTASLCALFPLACYVLVFLVPETPSWLAKKDRLEEAEASFKWLRGCDPEALEELNALLRRQREMKDEANTIKPASLKEQMSRPEFWKPLLIINLYFFTTQFSGVNAVAFYSVSIMQDTVGEGINEYLAMMIIDTIRLVMSVAACILTKSYGRRPLTLVSGLGTAASLIALAANSHLAGQHAWFAMTSLVGYITFVSIGLVPLPWALTGEVFPLAVRGIGSGLTTAMAFIAFFIVVKTCPIMFRDLGSGGTFFFYGSICLAGTIILYFFLPETRNKTLQEIEEHFASSKKTNKNEETA